MRLILDLSSNREVVPFNYQHKLVGTFHKWLGINELHDSVSLYSFSWLFNGKKVKDGLNFTNGSTWNLNAFDEKILKEIVRAIQDDNAVAFGMKVKSVAIQDDPVFKNENIFKVASPIFIKQTIENRQKFFYFNDPESGELMTQTLKNKLKKAGLSDEGVRIDFLKDYPQAKRKKVVYKGIENVGSICPVVVKGNAEQISFAWNVGVGNSTGIGFGSLI